MIKAKLQNLQDLNSRTFQRKDFSSTFKHLICFQALSRALKFLFQIQAFSRISQACYETVYQKRSVGGGGMLIARVPTTLRSSTSSTSRVLDTSSIARRMYLLSVACWK